MDHRKLYAEDSDEATEKFHRVAVEQGTSDTILVEQPREIRERVGTEERKGDACEERDPDADADQSARGSGENVVHQYEAMTGNERSFLLSGAPSASTQISFHI